MPQLEEILQQEAGAEIDAHLAEADSRVKEIISEAADRAKALLAEHRQRLDAEVRAAGQQAQSAAALINAVARTQAKGEVMDRVRQKVLEALAETPLQANYGEILQALAAEALKVAAEAQNLVVPPDDREKLMDWGKQQGLEVQTDPHLRLGVRIVCRGGRQVENTLPERLQRAWDTLAPEVTQLLWG
ncbi:MAG: V-type ATP synthase subunit E [Desulfobaccales bacterium]